jgi:glycosyltransferase involved in cell wall biosynthesis
MKPLMDRNADLKAVKPATTTVKKISICIVSHAGYGAIAGGNSGHVGGVERQTSLLALWLAERGHDVSFLTWDEGGDPEEVIGGVRVIKICGSNAGLPGLRFFHPKWTGLNRALAAADADVYYQNCGGCVTGQMALWCRRNRKPMLYSLASDAHSDPELLEMPTFRERTLYRFGLRNATRTVSQTAVQQRSLRDHFQVESEVIPMPAPGPSDADYQPPNRGNRLVLWVGRVCRVKRPDRLLEIARACPDLSFVMAGPVYDDEFSIHVAKDAASVPNVKMLGAVAREEISQLYRQASVLCCTSDYEGFPNTFLEAWSHGLPIVSTVDPDGLLERCDLGRVGAEPAMLAAGLKELLADDAVYAGISARARQRYVEFHSMEAVMPRFEKLFHELAASRSVGILPAAHEKPL